MRSQANQPPAAATAYDESWPAASVSEGATVATSADPMRPRCWAVLSYRTGDNNQILALAEALGLPFEVKHLVFRPRGRLVDVLRLTTLFGIDRRRSSPLGPPWPDLIISATLGNEAICRWIQRNADRQVRYVHIGRTWARLANFDLVVTSPEFRLKQRANVFHNHLGMTNLTPERLRAAAQSVARGSTRPGPRIGVLVGGYGGPYALDPAAGARLGREASALARKLGASLLVSTSRRTPPDVTDALERAIDVPYELYRWKPDDPANPYLTYLALADRFVVTCDSSVMLAEACATRRPVYMFDTGPGSPRSNAGSNKGLRPRLPGRCDVERWKALTYRLMLRLPPKRMTRDIRLVHAYLLASGRAVWLGQEFPPSQPPPLDDARRAAARVLQLIGRAAET